MILNVAVRIDYDCWNDYILGDLGVYNSDCFVNPVFFV